MYSGRRRWLARSNSEPPFPAAWALEQPPPSAADERPKSPSAGSSGSDISPVGSDQQPDRGRSVKRESHGDPATMGYSKLDEHAVDAGLGGNATINAAKAPPRKDDTINAYPEKLGNRQTFWIPFKLTPDGMSGTGRLTPINRRVPPHLRAAASALNLKMTYTKMGTGDYIFSHSSTPAPRTPHNERAAPTLGAAREVVQAEEKKEAVEAPLAQPNNDGTETNGAPEADLPAPPVAAPSTREVSANASGESSDASDESFIRAIPVEGKHACEEAIRIETAQQPQQPIEAMIPPEPSLPPVLEQHDAGPMIEALPVVVPVEEECKPTIIHVAPEIAPAAPVIPVGTDDPKDECVRVDDKDDKSPPGEAEKDIVLPADKEPDVPPVPEDHALGRAPPDEPSIPPPVVHAPSIAPAPPATANTSSQSTLREHPESKLKCQSKRGSLKGPLEHILNTHVEKPSAPSAPHPMAVVGVPRARSNTVVEQPPVAAPAKTSSRTAAMRVTASRLHAQLSVPGAADLEPDTDGEPNWAWDELNRQLDEEEERKRRAHYRPLADGTVNLDAWWIAFELAWEANMRKGRGVRTWWDLEQYWKPSEVFAAEDEAGGPLPETKTEKPAAAQNKEAKAARDLESSNTNANGEQTLVSSPEHSPRRSDSRNSLKTLAAPGTNQSKRSAAPQTQPGHPETKEIPEESAGHTTPTSLSNSVTSSGSSSPSSSKSRPGETAPQEASETQQAEPILRSSDFREMWEEAERRWAEEEKVPKGNKETTKDTPPSKANGDGTTRPEANSNADDRERARGRSREERPQSRTNIRPPIFQRNDYAPEGGQHKPQKEQEQSNVYAQSASAQTNMFSRRQSEPSLRAVEADPNNDILRRRRGRNVRPKLHIDTDLTDYTQSAPRMPKAKAKAKAQQPHVQPQPQVHPQTQPQAQPQHQPPPQARPVPPQHSQPQTHRPQQSHTQPQSQSKSQSRPAGRAPPPVVLRAVPVASDRTQSKIAVTWRAYEARWESMLAPSSKERITFATVPWPVLNPPKNYADGDGLAALSTLSIAQFLLSPDHSPGTPARDRLRAAIRRWHSDKFSRFTAHMRGEDGEDEAGKIMEGVGVVARALTQLLELERGD